MRASVCVCVCLHVYVSVHANKFVCVCVQLHSMTIQIPPTHTDPDRKYTLSHCTLQKYIYEYFAAFNLHYLKKKKKNFLNSDNELVWIIKHVLCNV